MHDGSARTWHFTNPGGRSAQVHDRDAVKELLQQLLPKFRSKVNSELEHKNRSVGSRSLAARGHQVCVCVCVCVCVRKCYRRCVRVCWGGVQNFQCVLCYFARLFRPPNIQDRWSIDLLLIGLRLISGWFFLGQDVARGPGTVPALQGSRCVRNRPCGRVLEQP